MNKIKGFALIAVAVFIFLSLISYNPDDTPFRTSDPNLPVKNLTGIVGAYMTEGLFFSIGSAAYFISLLMLVWATARLLEKPAPKLYIRICGTLILLSSISVLFSLFGAQAETLEFQRAGLAGTVIGAFLLKYFGRGGSLIIVIGLGVLSSFVSTEFLILPLLKGLGSGLSHLAKRLSPLFISIVRRPKERIATAVSPLRAKTLNGIKVKIEKPAIQARPVIRPPRPKPRIVRPEPAKQPVPAGVSKEREVFTDYKLPTLDLLDSPPPLKDRQIRDDLEANSRILEATLRDFGVETKVTQVSRGPVITRYELEPAPGVKVHRIVELSDDISLAMKAHTVRIVAPIPGKSRVGVEVPNSQSALVFLKEILESAEFQNAPSRLTLAIGKDISGQPIVTDLADMPHLLIAGTTGSGKTVCVNSIITSLLFNATPEELKFLMVDPKMVELAVFNNLPHLLCPVVTDAKKASSALSWVVNEMEQRYKLLAKVGARNIDIYNEKISTDLSKMPYLIVIIDELADLMVVASRNIEDAITRLAQLSRAVGIHLILATQRPSVDVITGVIKANFPARISFRVASKVDSRTVLDMNGADKLLGKGDLLFLRPGQHKPLRVQGTLIADKEIERIVGFIKSQKPADYDQQLLEAQEKKTGFGRKMEKDELFEEAVKVILQTRQASVSMLQRRLGLGYTRAARLIDAMEDEGIVGPYRGSKAREILIEKALSREAQEETS